MDHTRPRGVKPVSGPLRMLRNPLVEGRVGPDVMELFRRAKPIFCAGLLISGDESRPDERRAVWFYGSKRFGTTDERR